MKLEDPTLKKAVTANRPTIMGTKHVIAAGHYLAAHAGFEILEAIVIVARKLARIAFALYKSGQIFDAAKHLKSA
jgi:hypothetical protein